MTDEYETKLLAEDCVMALHVKAKCAFEIERTLCEIARDAAASDLAKGVYTDIINALTDCVTNLEYLSAQCVDAAHDFPSSRDLGEVCSKKKMGAVG